jgi:SAM-dependent methyltransferase
MVSRASALTSLVIRTQRAGNVAFDRLFRVDTAGIVGFKQLGFGPEVGEYYMPSNWVNIIGLWRILRGLHVQKSDGFLDLGCGKGQVVFLAAHFPFGRVRGIDLSSDLIAVARSNMDPEKHRFRCDSVDLVVGDAADYAIPEDVTMCYLYHPFPRPVMQQVMAHLDASLAANPRRMHIFYLEAFDTDLLEAHGFRQARRIRRLRQFVRDPQPPAGQGDGVRPPAVQADEVGRPA